MAPEGHRRGESGKLMHRGRGCGLHHPLRKEPFRIFPVHGGFTAATFPLHRSETVTDHVAARGRGWFVLPFRRSVHWSVRPPC